MKFNEWLASKGYEIKEDTPAEKMAEYYNEFNAIKQTELKEAIEKENKEAIAELKAEINESSTKQLNALNKAVREQGIAISEMLKGNVTPSTPINKGLRDYIEENSEVLKEMRANKENANKGFSFTIKATEVATDIRDRDYLGSIDTTIGIKPVRDTSILGLFKRRKVDGEYFHYWEEDKVTRDAKFVVACATSTHITGKTWVKRTVELAKIRDIVNICIDMINDYSFVESSMRKLIDESIALKADYELLLGASAASTDMLSIDSISSEFNAANPIADFSDATGTPFALANLEQLVDAMSAQISLFGELNAWMADTVIMNYKDFVNYRNLKDANGNKLVNTLSDNVATIAGLKVVTSPIVAPNTLYVMDSSKGEILDRQAVTFATSYENKDNIEHELVTLVGVQRLQFNVRLIDRDAFMKCSDVDAAITAITAS